jgi:hypothetical protein
MPRSRALKERARSTPKVVERMFAEEHDNSRSDKYNGRSDLGSRGTKGKEPGGRFAPAYYEGDGKTIGQNVTVVGK